MAKMPNFLISMVDSSSGSSHSASNSTDTGRALLYRSQIDGIIHCSGGAQTKVLHFIENLHIIKDNLFEIPKLFSLIQEESNTDWKEMYKVFNMGHRMELYVSEEIAKDIIKISKSFNVDAKVIGRVKASDKKCLTIKSEKGCFVYD